MAFNEYPTAAPQATDELLNLPSKVPGLPQKVLERFPDMEKYDAEWRAFWLRTRQMLSESHEALASPVNANTEAAKSLRVSTDNAFAAIEEERIARINEDGALASAILAVEVGYEAADAALTASIISEATARADGDSALATQITTLEADYQAADATLQANITTEQTARANADSALATDISAVEAGYEAADATIAASVTTEATARASADSALASDITSLEAAYEAADATLSAAIVAEESARADADDAEALARTTAVAELTTEIGVVSAAVTAETAARVDAFGDVYLRYGVSLDINGRVVGSINLDGTNESSSFKVAVDKFVVENVNGTITLLDIRAGGDIVFGADTMSDNYNGTDGWMLTRSGDFYAASGTFRGEVNAGAIIGGSIDIPDTGAVKISYSTFQNLGPDNGIGLEIGYYRTGAAPSWVDFHTTDDPGTDFEARLIRDTGPNGEFNLEQTGTGPIRIRHMDGGDIQLDTTGYVRFGTFVLDGGVGVVGYIEIKDASGIVVKLAAVA